MTPVHDLKAFLEVNGWAQARQTPLAGDLSTRRFFRLEKEDGARAILMVAGENQKTAAYARLSEILRGVGLAAPDVLAVHYGARTSQGAARPLDPEDLSSGVFDYALIEDFGDRMMGAAWDEGHDLEPYARATAKLLAQLHARFKPWQGAGLPVFDAEAFLDLLAPFPVFYPPYKTRRTLAAASRTRFFDLWRDLLREVDAAPRTLLLRDFMPDNLMLLGANRQTIGVIDFQEAGLGPAAYDLSSFCEEARRSGCWRLWPIVLETYHALHPAQRPEDLTRQAVILSAQRHVRLLGNFVKLGGQGGRPDLFAKLPFIEAHVTRLLAHEALAPLRRWFDEEGLLP